MLIFVKPVRCTEINGIKAIQSLNEEGPKDILSNCRGITVTSNVYKGFTSSNGGAIYGIFTAGRDIYNGSSLELIDNVVCAHRLM